MPRYKKIPPATDLRGERSTKKKKKGGKREIVGFEKKGKSRVGMSASVKGKQRNLGTDDGLSSDQKGNSDEAIGGMRHKKIENVYTFMPGKNRNTGGRQ